MKTSTPSSLLLQPRIAASHPWFIAPAWERTPQASQDSTAHTVPTPRVSLLMWFILTVSRSGRNKQESHDVQLTAQINCSDVQGVAHIKIRCPQESLGQSRKEQIHSVHSFCFRVRLVSERGKFWKCLWTTLQIQWEMECIAWEQTRKIALNYRKGHLD